MSHLAPRLAARLSVRLTLAAAGLAVTATAATVVPTAAASPQAAAPTAAQLRVVAADDFDDARFPCPFPCLFPPTSGNANEPVSADSAPPYTSVPRGIRYVSNADLDGSTGPNPRGASGLSGSRPSTWGGNATRGALGASNGSIDALLDLDARAVDVDANAVKFSFTNEPQPAPAVVVAAYGPGGRLLDSVSFVAGSTDGPVRLEVPVGREIARVNASSPDGVVTLHGLAVSGPGEMKETPTPAPAPCPLPINCG